MIPVDTINEESKCYTCLGISEAEALKLALLNRIGSGPSFIPSDLAGLMWWLKADADVSPSTNGAAVQTWDDQMGNIDFSQAVLANRPTYATNSINGLPTVDWSTVFADNRFMDASTPGLFNEAAGSIFTFFAAVQVGALDGDTQRLIHSGAGGASFFTDGATGNAIFQKNAGGFETLTGTVSVSAQVVVLMVTRSGAGAGDTKIYVNNVQGDNGTAIPDLAFPATSFLGISVNQSWQGKVMELGAYNSVLSNDDRLTLFNYLRGRLGI